MRKIVDSPQPKAEVYSPIFAAAKQPLNNVSNWDRLCQNSKSIHFRGSLHPSHDADRQLRSDLRGGSQSIVVTARVLTLPGDTAELHFTNCPATKRTQANRSNVSIPIVVRNWGRITIPGRHLPHSQEKIGLPLDYLSFKYHNKMTHPLIMLCTRHKTGG